MTDEIFLQILNLRTSSLQSQHQQCGGKKDLTCKMLSEQPISLGCIQTGSSTVAKIEVFPLIRVGVIFGFVVRRQDVSKKTVPPMLMLS